ncbi:hypothetical protein [Ulvibacter antarcticus]|uniref:Cleaved adhesin domain-containing protein n=1 Tax=Ulvibacter antarcticus TaxID=442714 RepID=A0A3L9YKX9_9FLAO|nr:hypothetical protein [Ulvibacter antarcticus]RMA58668.1 hypothetical protein BXY75_2042 [Ulvibacter antarcticus]
MKPQISAFSFASLLAIFVCTSVNAQVGIGNSNPDKSSLLEIGSGNDAGGLLVPRVALSAANISAPISTPENSLFVYNTATNLSPAGYINDVRPGFYSWDTSRNRWVTQTKETRTAKWKSTNTTEQMNTTTPTQVNLFGTNIWNDDSSLFNVSPSDTEDELFISEAGRYELNFVIGLEVIEADKYEEIVVKCEVRLRTGGVYSYPGVSVYGYINDDNDIYRTSMQINDIIEIPENTTLSVWVTREVDEAEVYLEDTGSCVLTIRKVE